jgi:antitoxin YefM
LPGYTLDFMYSTSVPSLWEKDTMPVETTYTQLRKRLAAFREQVASDQEAVIVRRRGGKDVALVPAQELTSLIETAHLLRSPRNAQRLLTALQRAARRRGRPESIDKLRQEWL